MSCLHGHHLLQVGALAWLTTRRPMAIVLAVVQWLSTLVSELLKKHISRIVSKIKLVVIIPRIALHRLLKVGLD